MPLVLSASLTHDTIYYDYEGLPERVTPRAEHPHIYTPRIKVRVEHNSTTHVSILHLYAFRENSVRIEGVASTCLRGLSPESIADALDRAWTDMESRYVWFIGFSYWKDAILLHVRMGL